MCSREKNLTGHLNDALVLRSIHNMLKKYFFQKIRYIRYHRWYLDNSPIIIALFRIPGMEVLFQGGKS